MGKTYRGFPVVPPEDFVVTAEVFKEAYPEVYKQIFQEGRLIGFAEGRGEGVKRTNQATATTVARDAPENQEDKKTRLLREHREAHPGVSLKDAVLAIGKKYPELWR